MTEPGEVAEHGRRGGVRWCVRQACSREGATARIRPSEGSVAHQNPERMDRMSKARKLLIAMVLLMAAWLTPKVAEASECPGWAYVYAWCIESQPDTCYGYCDVWCDQGGVSCDPASWACLIGSYCDCSCKRN